MEPSGAGSESATPASSAAQSPDPDPSEAVPTEESLPATELPPVAQPSPQGGPWDEIGVTVSTPEELAAAQGIPDSLRAFLGTQLGVEDASGCTTTQIEVAAVHRDGYAFGSSDASCGSELVAWGIAESQWRYLVAFDDAMPCSDLALNHIPTGVPGLRCLDDEGALTGY